ncbi:MAG: ROK family protein [Bacteroidetes bacterium]|nr:ROK family protein [Bacteroidota bacterium]
MITIGIDIGGSSIKAALTDAGQRIVARTRRPTMAEYERERTISQIDECIGELLAHVEARDVEGIGVGVPGAIDLENGVVYYPPNLPGWGEVPLADILSRKWDIPVRLDNDANCAALGEAHFGAGRQREHFVGLTLGTGVGAGIIIGGRIYHGQRGFAGEFGHITINSDGPLCNCGNHGCVEAYVGIHYMMREAIPLLRADMNGLLYQRAIANPESLMPVDLSEAAQQGDTTSRDILRDTGKRLGIAIASAANLLDITTFLIGGGIAAAGDPLFEGIIESAIARVLKVHRDSLTILPAELGNDAGMLGAASLML